MVSEKEACSNSTNLCAIPKPLSCSFHGCLDPIKHEKAYEVINFGPTGKMLRGSTIFTFCGLVTQRKVHIQSYNESLFANDTETLDQDSLDVMDMKPCSGPNSVSIEGLEWPCLVVHFDLCGPDSVSFEPADHIGELITDCGDEKTLKPAGDHCGDEINQCWKINFLESEEVDEAFIISLDGAELLQSVASEVESTIENFIKKNGFLNDSKFATPSFLKQNCIGNDIWELEDLM